jgi:hypothetical protein
MESLLNRYNFFYGPLGKTPDPSSNSKRSAFWMICSLLHTRLSTDNPDKRVSIVWTNLLKLGRNTIRFNRNWPKSEVKAVELSEFNVLREEIAILKPNVVVFLSAPNYDLDLEQRLGELAYTPVEPYTALQLARIHIPGVGLALRGYHPSYWSFGLRPNLGPYFEAIVSQIQSIV